MTCDTCGAEINVSRGPVHEYHRRDFINCNDHYEVVMVSRVFCSVTCLASNLGLVTA